VGGRRGVRRPDAGLQRAESRRPADVISIGFVDIAADQLEKRLAEVAAQEHVRHERIDTVVESTTLRRMYAVRAEHDFTTTPREIALASPESLLAALLGSS
jgi:hypothetical protein